MTSSDGAPPSLLRWLAPLAAAVAAVCMQLGPAITDPLKLQVGSIYSEAPGHLWGLWTTADRFWTVGPFLRVADVNYPSNYVAHLMDPINLLLFMPGYWLAGGGMAGASLGWNLVNGGSVVIGALGCLALGRRVFRGHEDEPYAIAVMIAAFCMGPFLLQQPNMGRTEYLPAVYLPLFIALFHRWMSRPAGWEGEVEANPPLWVGLAAGLSLAAIALGGWYLAIFSALLVPPLSIGLAIGLRPLVAIRRLILVAVVAVLPTIPALWALIKHPPEKHALDSLMANMPIQTGQFAQHTFPSMFHVPSEDTAMMWMGQPAYIGVAATLFAIIGACWRPKKVLGWLLLAVWAFSIAAGPFAVMGKDRASMADPGHLPVYYLLTAAPQLRGVHDWSRIGVMAALPMGLAAAFGYLALSRLTHRARAVLLLTVGLIIADQTTYPKTWSPQQPWFDAAAPAELIEGLATLPPGPMVELPVDISHRLTGGPEIRGLYYLWQLQHHRPVPAVPAAVTDTTLAHSVFVRMIITQQDISVALRDGSVDPASGATRPLATPTPSEQRCALADIRDLRARGYTVVALTTSLAGGWDLADYVTGLLGQPTWSKGKVYLWDLAKVPPPEVIDDTIPIPCEKPSLPTRLARNQRSADR